LTIIGFKGIFYPTNNWRCEVNKKPVLVDWKEAYVEHGGLLVVPIRSGDGMYLGELRLQMHERRTSTSQSQHWHGNMDAGGICITPDEEAARRAATPDSVRREVGQFDPPTPPTISPKVEDALDADLANGPTLEAVPSGLKGDPSGI